MWTSNAKWSDFEDTSDTHLTKEEAQAVCSILESDYNRFTPCEVRGVCISTWIEEVI